MSDQDDDSRVGLRVVAIIVIAVVAAVVGFAVSLAGKPGTDAEAVEVVEVIEVPEPVGEALARVYFAVGSAEPGADVADAVARVRAALIAAPDAIVLLSGFHDPSGDAAQNAELAKARALAVRDALVASGVVESGIKLRKPEIAAADGPPEEARRVELRVQ
ncbi:OmpA family protein [Methyloversatilis sp.]|uniref:OmpA family protein n=1 Tax=Methyloversatilis sp. TaxID=2569862 RepID=UPI0035B25C76